MSANNSQVVQKFVCVGFGEKKERERDRKRERIWDKMLTIGIWK